MRSTMTNITISVMKRVSVNTAYQRKWCQIGDNCFHQRSLKHLHTKLLWTYHIKPKYPQSNGTIEWKVQTLKQCLKKCMAAGHDHYLTMLIHRATPSSSSLPASAELLNGRKYSALLPTRSLMQNAQRQLVREHMVEDKERSPKH